jgi:hypothetical protein
VRAARHLLLVLSLACAVGLSLTAVAGASGCNNSAGDNQYVDPLQQCQQGGSTTPTTSTPTGTTTAPATTTTSTSAAATVATSSTTTTNTASARDPKSSKTLPFTGFDVGPALIVACALLGGGFALRRLAGRPSRP